MSRRRRRSSSVSPAAYGPPVIPPYFETRDPSAIASGRDFSARVPLRFFPQFLPRSSLTLLPLEDRRTWHPDSVRPYAGLRNSRHRLRSLARLDAMGAERPRQPPRSGLRLMPGFNARREAVPIQVGFVGAPSVLVCIRRRQRREVLFARGRPAGRPRRFRRPRWRQSSYLTCGRR